MSPGAAEGARETGLDAAPTAPPGGRGPARNMLEPLRPHLPAALARAPVPGCHSQCPRLPPSPPQQPLRCFPPGLVLDKLESRAFAKKLQTVQKHHKDGDTSFDSVTVIRSQSHLSQKQQFFGACGAEPVCCSRGGHCCGAPRKHRAAPNGLPDGELQTRRPVREDVGAPRPLCHQSSGPP